MADTAHAKLITIIASSELEERLEKDLRRLGAAGHTVARVEGRGKHGPRTRGMFDVGNVRIETIVSPAVAEVVLAHLAKQGESLDFLSFEHDVDAVPRSHFE